MDMATANTAFLAGQGDVVGVWGPIIHSEDKKELVMVSSDAWVKTGIVTNYVASPLGWARHEEAIKKWLEVSLMAGEWAMQNIEEAAQYMVEFNEIDGFPMVLEDGIRIITNNPFATLEENYLYYTEKINDRFKSVHQIYVPMSGFVEIGNFTEDQLNAVVKGDNFLPNPIVEIYHRVQAKR